MHGNRRYVKSTWIGLLAGLAFASPTRAEVVTRAADQGLLAVAPDGTPRVAYAVGRDLHVARRSGATWTTMAIDPTGKVTGSVVGASGGAVQIFREIPHAPRE